MRRFLLAGLLIIVFSCIQSLGVSFFGVKPNFILATAIIAVFFVSDFIERFFLISLATFMLKFSPGFMAEILWFFLIGILSVVFAKYFLWQRLVSGLLSVLASTVLFYAFLYPEWIISTTFFVELMYNLIVGLMIYLFLAYFADKNFN